MKEQTEQAAASLTCLALLFFSAVIAVAVAGVLVGVFLNVVKAVMR
jgi:hypothetical protein